MTSWSRGEIYEPFMGRWSRLVAPAFLSWLDRPPGARWLDVGCGTGALSSAIIAVAEPSSVVGVDASPDFVDFAAKHLTDPRVSFRAGDAQALPVADGSVEVVVSALLLNFLQDRRAALREMRRATTAGGTVAAYVWDYSGQMQMLSVFWDAAVELDPVARSAVEGVRFDSCRPVPLRDLFVDAGLSDVDVQDVVIEMPFVDIDDYWLPFLGGQGPAPSYVTSLSAERRGALRAAVRARLPVDGDGSIRLAARAWAVRGVNE